MSNSEGSILDKIEINKTYYSIISPEQCPICHRHIAPEMVTHSVTPQQIAQVVYRCSSDKCQELFIAYYAIDRKLVGFDIKYRDTKPKSVETISFPGEVVSLSPNFVEIYSQAKSAENNDLNQICGPGYRKSLEFLIKEYLISSGEHSEEEIKGKLLGKCIELIKDDRIRKCAERATWLGNDETHYVRRWEEKDISNLKELIELTVHWIAMELITQRYTNEMPKPQSFI